MRDLPDLWGLTLFERDYLLRRPFGAFTRYVAPFLNPNVLMLYLIVFKIGNDSISLHIDIDQLKLRTVFDKFIHIFRVVRAHLADEVVDKTPKA